MSDLKRHFADATLHVMAKVGLLKPYMIAIDTLLVWLCEVERK